MNVIDDSLQVNNQSATKADFIDDQNVIKN